MNQTVDVGSLVEIGHGLPLGVEAGIPFESSEVQTQPGDAFVYVCTIQRMAENAEAALAYFEAYQDTGFQHPFHEKMKHECIVHLFLLRLDQQQIALVFFVTFYIHYYLLVGLLRPLVLLGQNIKQ
jgi:hypothetical protein